LDNLLAVDGSLLKKSAAVDERFLDRIGFPAMDWRFIGLKIWKEPSAMVCDNSQRRIHCKLCDNQSLNLTPFGRRLPPRWLPKFRRDEIFRALKIMDNQDSFGMFAALLDRTGRDGMIVFNGHFGGIHNE
jgi:hypothetical protein